MSCRGTQVECIALAHDRQAIFPVPIETVSRILAEYGAWSCHHRNCACTVHSMCKRSCARQADEAFATLWKWICEVTHRVSLFVCDTWTDCFFFPAVLDSCVLTPPFLLMICLFRCCVVIAKSHPELNVPLRGQGPF